MYKYLYAVNFEDGSVINQTHEDRSSLDPSKSIFYDVLQRQKESAVKSIVLHNPQEHYMLEFASGNVTFNGEVVHVSTNRQKVTTPLRAICSRDVEVEYPSGAMRIKCYYIGWQTTTESGENVQEVFQIEA